jgi:hypothetical protein
METRQSRTYCPTVTPLSVNWPRHATRLPVILAAAGLVCRTMLEHSGQLFCFSSTSGWRTEPARPPGRRSTICLLVLIGVVCTLQLAGWEAVCFPLWWVTKQAMQGWVLKLPSWICRVVWPLRIAAVLHALSPQQTSGQVPRSAQVSTIFGSLNPYRGVNLVCRYLLYLWRFSILAFLWTIRCPQPDGPLKRTNIVF